MRHVSSRRLNRDRPAGAAPAAAAVADSLPPCYGGECPDADAWERCRSDRPDVFDACQADHQARQASKDRATSRGKLCSRYGDYSPERTTCQNCCRSERDACIHRTEQRQAERDAQRAARQAEMMKRRAELPFKRQESMRRLERHDDFAREMFRKPIGDCTVKERFAVYCAVCEAQGLRIDDEERANATT